MFIKNDELDVLIQVEELLHKKLYDEGNSSDEEKNLWNTYWNIIEKLLQQKDKRNIKNYDRIKAKRATNENYARSKQEIERKMRVRLTKEIKKAMNNEE